MWRNFQKMYPFLILTRQKLWLVLKARRCNQRLQSRYSRQSSVKKSQYYQLKNSEIFKPILNIQWFLFKCAFASSSSNDSILWMEPCRCRRAVTNKIKHQQQNSPDTKKPSSCYDNQDLFPCRERTPRSTIGMGIVYRQGMLAGKELNSVRHQVKQKKNSTKTLKDVFKYSRRNCKEKRNPFHSLLFEKTKKYLV